MFTEYSSGLKLGVGGLCLLAITVFITALCTWRKDPNVKRMKQLSSTFFRRKRERLEAMRPQQAKLEPTNTVDTHFVVNEVDANLAQPVEVTQIPTQSQNTHAHAAVNYIRRNRTIMDTDSAQVQERQEIIVETRPDSSDTTSTASQQPAQVLPPPDEDDSANEAGDQPDEGLSAVQETLNGVIIHEELKAQHQIAQKKDVSHVTEKLLENEGLISGRDCVQLQETGHQQKTCPSKHTGIQGSRSFTENKVEHKRVKFSSEHGRMLPKEADKDISLKSCCDQHQERCPARNSDVTRDSQTDEYSYDNIMNWTTKHPRQSNTTASDATSEAQDSDSDSDEEDSQGSQNNSMSSSQRTDSAAYVDIDFVLRQLKNARTDDQTDSSAQ